MNNIDINLPSDVQTIISTIEKNGNQAFAVGGCVRDTLLGKEPDDWDITTSALPHQVKSYFKRTVDTGIAHGTVTIMIGKTGYEVTTYRIDGNYSDGRHPDSVEFAVTLKEDLMRRDFTINAMAYNEKRGLVDEFNGVEDLENQIIRAVGNPMERFKEDALRMMRAIRFSAQLGFEIEAKTFSAINALATTISKVSMERVQVELTKTLLSYHPEYVRSYATTGLFRDILPLIQDNLTNNNAKRILTRLQYSKNDKILRYAILLSYKSPLEAEATLRRLKMDNKTINMVSKIIEFCNVHIDETEPAVREALSKYGKDLFAYLIDYEEADVFASEQIIGLTIGSKKKHLTSIKRIFDEVIRNGDCFTIKDLDITGNDLIEYGLSGQDIGKALESLLAVVIENPKLNEKGTLIGLLERITGEL